MRKAMLQQKDMARHKDMPPPLDPRARPTRSTSDTDEQEQLVAAWNDANIIRSNDDGSGAPSGAPSAAFHGGPGARKAAAEERRRLQDRMAAEQLAREMRERLERETRATGDVRKRQEQRADLEGRVMALECAHDSAEREAERLRDLVRDLHDDAARQVASATVATFEQARARAVPPPPIDWGEVAELKQQQAADAARSAAEAAQAARDAMEHQTRMEEARAVPAAAPRRPVPPPGCGVSPCSHRLRPTARLSRRARLGLPTARGSARGVLLVLRRARRPCATRRRRATRGAPSRTRSVVSRRSCPC